MMQMRVFILAAIVLVVAASSCPAGGDPDNGDGPGRFQETVYRYLKNESGLEVMDKSVIVRPPRKGRAQVEGEELEGWTGEVRAHAADRPGGPMEPRVFCYFIQHGRVKALAERGASPWCP